VAASVRITYGRQYPGLGGRAAHYAPTGARPDERSKPAPRWWRSSGSRPWRVAR